MFWDMPKFVSQIESIEYDFTKIPKAGGEPGEMCAGSGTVPEPSDEQVAELVTFLQTLFDRYERDEAGDIKIDNTGEPIVKKEAQDWLENRAEATEALAAVNIPKEHLDELPARQFKEFLWWFVGEYAGIGA